MTPIDDMGRFNSYPLMRVQAVDIDSGVVVATTDAVVPVSTEVDCRDCHALGEVGSDSLARGGVPAFIAAATTDRVDVEAAAKHNILVLHDFKHGTNFVMDDQPVLCASCHGSLHAIWPNRDPNANDNVTSIQLQGHAGTVRECTVCHDNNSFPNGTLEGPHGMHPVNDPNWIKSKGDFYHEDFVWNNGVDQCASCHGADHLGTRLSKVPVDRVLTDADGVVRATLAAGEIVSCDLCHSIDKSFEN